MCFVGNADQNFERPHFARIGLREENRKHISVFKFTVALEK